MDKTHYFGTIKQLKFYKTENGVKVKNNKSVKVIYDDGDREWLDLKKEEYVLLSCNNDIITLLDGNTDDNTDDNKRKRENVSHKERKKKRRKLDKYNNQKSKSKAKSPKKGYKYGYY